MRSKLNTKIRELFDEKRAVSPVIGVILMVAIVVILAAVIGFFVLGLGSETDSAPQASFSFEGVGATAAITHDGGDAIDDGTLTVIVAGGEDTGGSWGSDPITAGTVYTYGTPPAAGEEVRIVWTGESGDTQTLGSYTAPS